METMGDNESVERGELLVETRRLARTFLDRIEQGSKDGSLDQGQLRMLGSLALRSLRLWNEVLRKRDKGSKSVSHASNARWLARSLEKGVEGCR